jgi:hypothetical protein
MDARDASNVVDRVRFLAGALENGELRAESVEPEKDV